MANKNKVKERSTGKARLRSELVEALRGLHKIGAVSDAELGKTTLRMLGRDALPKVDAFSPSEIAKLRARAGVRQAGYGGLSQCSREHGQPVGARGDRRAHARCHEPQEIERPVRGMSRMGSGSGLTESTWRPTRRNRRR